MGRSVDLTGRVFTRLTVLSSNGKDKHGHNLWLSQCLCGNQKITNTSDLLSGNTSSCGCLRKEVSIENGKNNKVHGMAKTPGYKSWLHMVDRCTNENHPYYEYYGGRGIKVCDEWLNSPESFLKDVGPKPSKNHSIDRYPDNNGNYEPGNCRWATTAEQNRNTRKNVIVEYNSKKFVLKDLADELNLDYDSLRYFVMQKKISINDAINNSKSNDYKNK